MTDKSNFVVAEEIAGLLKDKNTDDQNRILRWVSESLGLPTKPAPSAAAPPATGAPAVTASPPAAPRSKDIKSFVKEKNPKNDVQFAAVSAYFYRFECTEPERKDVLAAADLDNAGRLARGYGFTNPNSTLNNAVALGYFDRAGYGKFKLNAVGENLVAMTLPGGSDTGAREPRRAKGKKKTATIDLCITD